MRTLADTSLRTTCMAVSGTAARLEQGRPRRATAGARGLSCHVTLLCAALAVAGCGREGGPATAETGPISTRPFLEEVEAAALSANVRARITERPHNLFRFVNRAWTRAVCAAFAEEVPRLPSVHLHGDAHLEQYALTTTERGLEDFDDAAVGPSVVDLVRFIGSIKLAAFERGWGNDADAMVDAFLDGYRRGLEQPSYVPQDPAVVVRLRARPVPTPLAFLEQSESMMRPLPAAEQARFDANWPTVAAHAREVNPEASPAWLRIKRVGWLRLGIGSALGRKLLVRVDGPSTAPDDDIILEGKEIVTLSGVPCLTVPASGELFRVVEGLTQVGRLQHTVVVVVPVFPAERPESRGWWIRSWQPAYQEVDVADLASATELSEVAHDAGAQLGSTNLQGTSNALTSQKRLLELENVRRLEPRIRLLADDLQRAILEAWRTLRQPAAPRAPAPNSQTKQE